MCKIVINKKYRKGPNKTTEIANNNSRISNIVGYKGRHKDNEEVEQEISTVRREKRDISPSSSVGSWEDRLRKNRKAQNEAGFGGDEVGRRSITKAMEVARRTGALGSWENKKGISDIYKEYYEEEGETNEIFRFKSTKDGEAESVRCNMNME
ncbi:hypothetical protein Tco_1441738 [Tanacetum coccineum]